MTPQRSFVRKNVYLASIVVLLVPLYLLSRPATPPRQGGEGSPGGLLARMREEEKLSQTQLGQIDPAGETIRLATLGMRGVATLVLWEKSNQYFKKHDWVNFSATVMQMTKLQPHFVSVWRYQGWVFSYNCSAQFDDYRARYLWVMKGVKFLQDGIRYNEHAPILLWDVGWIIAHKLGSADEVKQHRRQFKADDEFHGSRPLAERDNWLVGKQWFREACRRVDAGDKINKTPVLFRCEPAMCQMHYCEAIEKEGTFGEVAQREWRNAATEWQAFGDEDIPTSDKTYIRLNDEEVYRDKYARCLDKIDPGGTLRAKIEAELRGELTEAQRAAVDLAPSARTTEQTVLAAEAESRLRYSVDDVARRVAGAARSEALKLAKEAKQHDAVINRIEGSRQTVNFKYWKLRADVEQRPETVAARQWIHQADEAFELGELPDAKLAYRHGFDDWNAVMESLYKEDQTAAKDPRKKYLGRKYEEFMESDTTGRDLMDVIRRYQQFLEQCDEDQLFAPEIAKRPHWARIRKLHEKKQ
jgi:hypothetical protein